MEATNKNKDAKSINLLKKELCIKTAELASNIPPIAKSVCFLFFSLGCNA